MEILTETVYPAEWPGFPGESGARQQARADLRIADESLDVLPADALAINEVLKNEEDTAFRQADRSPIYDYEIEIQRPVPPIERVSEKAGWRQRAKQAMARASETIKETSISALAAGQAKIEDSRNDRAKIIGKVAGAVALAGVAYFEYKGLGGGSTAVRELSQTHHNAGETLARNHEHVRHLAQLVLRKDDNPWTETEAQLHAHGVAHPSKARIAADDARLMKLNHISPLQALKLHVGTKLNQLKKW